MIGELDRHNKKVSVVGGGASGLFCAYFLDRAGYEVSLYEASERLGGLVETRSEEHGLVECAANSLVMSAELAEMCADLKVDLEPLRPGAKAKFILREGALRRMPLGLWALVKVLIKFFFVRAKRPYENLRAMAEVHLGKEAADFLIEPMVTGIYGVSAKELAPVAAMPRLDVQKGESLFGAVRRYSREHASGGKDKRTVVAPVGGMQTLIDALGTRLKGRLGERLHLGAKLEELPVGNVVIATPANAAAGLLADRCPKVAELIDQVKYTPMISAGVFLRKDQLHICPQGLGVLLPPKEQRFILGVLFTSSSFSGRSNRSEDVLLTVMMAGSHHPELLDLSDAGLQAVLMSELDQIFGVQGHPLAVHINRWPRAIPIYDKGLYECWRGIEAELRNQTGLVLAGNYTGEVSLRGMLADAARFAQACRPD